MIPSKTNAQYYGGGYVGNGGYVVSGGNISSENYNQYNPTPVYVNTYETVPVVKTNTTDSNTTTTKTTTTNSTNTSVNNANTGNNSNLAANAVFGSNSFIPSRLIQWVIVAILILFIVVLVRRIYGGAEKYQSTPLKHS